MRQFADYTLAETLYEGRETRVQRAIHVPSGERLVVKLPVLDPPSLHTMGRLLHEYQILCRLSAVPGVVQVRAMIKEAGSAALFLQDPNLRSLDRILAEQARLPLAAALRVALALCRVLEGVHATGIIHKDIKPQNILLNKDCSSVVLIDFGIASELAQEATEAGLPESLEGTLAYISPEQTGRTARGLDARTDLYSLGVTLFEMLTGQHPFEDNDALALVYAHLAKAPPALESLLPDIPSTVARLVERCLEKSPEKRYQTAKGLAADLERCLLLLSEHGRIEPFAIGQRDFSPKLQIPQTLVGREKESQAVTAAFERAAAGAVEVLLLGGPSGIGKTALVRAVYRDIAKAGRGHLLFGKHDQLGRAVPYAAIAQAFSGLMRSLAASPKPVFLAWRERLSQALGPLARVIADLVPELEWVMGTLPAVPTVPTEMAYNRLKLAWIDFLRAVTDASPPLVLFLDDMQWVDPASLELLKSILTSVGRQHLLVIAAYRDNEVEPSHPLWTLVLAIEKSGVQTTRLSVGPLSQTSVQKWLAATLSEDSARIQALAEVLSRKTQGNPFFLGQLLLEFHRQKQLRRDLEDGTWQWEKDAIARAEVTENVAELMRSKVGDLPECTQELLGKAACAGHSFRFDELVMLTELSPSQVEEELRPALLAELVVPSDGQYRAVQALAQAEQRGEISASYQFLHDRVQQAFYERIAPAQRAFTHLWIGRRLEARFHEQEGIQVASGRKLLELVRHLNLGAAALHSDTERKALARLNLQAAAAAKVNGSYRLQAALAEKGQELLEPRAWDKEPQLMAELAMERLEADHLLREFAEVHRRAQELLVLPLSPLTRLMIQELQVRTCVASGQYIEGERLGLAVLAERGMTYPATQQECIAQALQGAGTSHAWLEAHSEGFDLVPSDPSLEGLFLDALQVSMQVCIANGGNASLGAVVITRNVERTIEKAALTSVSPFFLSAFGCARSAFFADYRGDVRWAQSGLQAAMRLSSPCLPECAFIRAVYAAFEEPVEQTRRHYQTAQQVARASGSFQGTGWGLFGEIHYVDIWSGSPLDRIAAQEASQRDLMNRAGDFIGQLFFKLAADYVAFLRPTSFVRAALDAEWLTANSRSFEVMNTSSVAELARVLETHLFLAFGEYARALARAAEAEQFRFVLYGAPAVTDIPLWQGLAAAKCVTSALESAERASFLATLDHAIERFRYFSQGCAANFLHKLRLLEAEQARLSDKIGEAMAKYEEAITLARKERFLHIEALAAQYCAEFHLAAGRQRVAALYLHEARDAYTRWNALALVSFLEQKYSALLVPSSFADLSTDRTRTATSMTSTTGGVAIDVNTTVRAAQALARELDSERIVAELMRLVQENAGAQRAALLLAKEDQLSISALLSNSQVRAGLKEPLSASHPVALSVVQYILRSREDLVLGNASSDARFAQDPYLHAASIRSVLAVPLLHQGRLGGILYLEHETANAFPESRVHLLGVLAAQSAIALENARLYADLQAANIGLEAKVEERTAALDKALQDLWSEMDLAKKIQTVLLPSTPQISGYELAAVMCPADQVGGDYYDVFRRGQQDWVVIGDVSGHGVPAGLCMMMIQSVLRAVALTLERSNEKLTPHRLLGLCNEAVESNLTQIGRGQYMTITALCIEGGTVRYAGLHQDLLIYRAAQKRVERIETQGVWLGVVEGDISELLQDNELRLEVGDVLLLYTDGYTEATVAEQYLETAGLAKSLAELCERGLPTSALLAGLLAPLKQAKICDDITLVALRRLPAPSESL